MRKLFSVGALLAASTLTLWQPKPANAEARVVIVVRHRPHYHYYRYHHYRHGYYRYYGYW